MDNFILLPRRLAPLTYAAAMEIPDYVCARLGLREERGYIGALTRNWAPGAFLNGSLVEKCNSEKDDIHFDGTRGCILGSLYVPPGLVGADGGYFYSVEWDPSAGFALFITGRKVRLAKLSTKLMH